MQKLKAGKDAYMLGDGLSGFAQEFMLPDIDIEEHTPLTEANLLEAMAPELASRPIL